MLGYIYALNEYRMQSEKTVLYISPDFHGSWWLMSRTYLGRDVSFKALYRLTTDELKSHFNIVPTSKDSL